MIDEQVPPRALPLTGVKTWCRIGFQSLPPAGFQP
jgi:hypothetical protein